MKLDDRARRAAEEIHRATDGLDRSGEAPDPLERFRRFLTVRRRRQRVGAVALTAVIAAAGVAIVVRAFGPTTTRPAVANSPTGVLLYGAWDPKSQQAHWYTVSPDGSEVHDLHVVATCAQWWPDGSKIFVTDDAHVGPGSPLRPATIMPDGSGFTRLDATSDSALNLGCGDVSPDGSRIALEGFGTQRSGVGGIYTVRAVDGGDLVRLTHAPPGGSDNYPQFAPDGRRVVFQRTRPGINPDGAGALFVVSTDGTGLHRITPWGDAFLGESWSPGGGWIAFQRPYGQLYLVHPDGTALHRIPIVLPAGAGATEPQWSPDGTWIVFSLQQGGTASLYLVRSDGTDLRQVIGAPAGVQETGPDWAP